MNKNLPELSVWQARSTYAMIVALLSSILAGFGVTLPADLAPDLLTDFLFNGVTVVGVLWAWYERRSPQYTLVLKRKNGPIV